MAQFLSDFNYKHDLPKGWAWSTIGKISLKIHYGYTAKADKKSTGIKMLRITDIQQNSVDWDNVPSCKIDEDNVSRYLLKEGDIVFARTGATVGKSYLIDENVPNAVFASYLIRIILSKQIEKKFVYYFFQSPFYWNQIHSEKSGTGQ
ncbi:MAG: type I restriction endonuclease subunit S, partial [Patescibacteria group bacterium]|nr:type I restriction endonuclease subunit S [Patescibacteria group bacterium]